MLQLFAPRPDVPTHADLFLEHYPRLLAWARQLTKNDVALAFALVHDAYIHFVLVQPPLDQIRSVEAYLVTTLRNMYVSQQRRALRSPIGPESIVDYDTASLGLRTLELRERTRTRLDLAAICQYALARKASSRAASALILRFFHGFYPAEIARLFVSSTGAVATLIHLARAEARDYAARAAEPGTMPGAAIGAGASLGPLEPEAFLRSLRDRILGEEGGGGKVAACFERRQLRARYQEPSKRPRRVSTEAAAHLVSCRACLDEACDVLGLPRLDERDPIGSSGPDTPASGGRSAAGGTPAGRRAASSAAPLTQQRLREVVEHRPRELRLAINGMVVVTQPVTSARAEHTLSLEVARDAEFVEVLSEQDVRLLFVNVVSPPAGALAQETCITLGDDRTLCLTVDFTGRWPHLHVVYRGDVAALDTPDAQIADEQRSVPVQAIGRANEAPRWWTAFRHPRLRLALALFVLVLLAGAAAAPVTAAELAMRIVRAMRALVGLSDVPSDAPAVEAPTGRRRAARDIELPVASASRVAPPLHAGPSTRDLVEAEVAVLHALDNAGALLGEQISLRRTAARVRVDGVVEDRLRRQALIAALAPVRHRAFVDVDLRVAGELPVPAKRRHATGREQAEPDAMPAATAPEMALTKDEPPAYALIRHALQTSPSTADVRRVATDLLAAGDRVMLHRWAIENLVARVPPSVVVTLGARASEEWHAMLHAHARELDRALAAVLVRLQPLVDVPSSTAPQPAPSIACDDVAARISDLTALLGGWERTLRANLSRTSSTDTAGSLGAPSFWDDAVRARAAAAQLAEARCAPFSRSR